jgi:cell division protein FtsQ
VTATLFYYPKPINNLFIIDKIIIEGSIKSNQNKIKKDVEEFSRYLIGLNSHDLKRILEENDWVKRTNIKKVFPSILIINIIENHPYAIYLDDGKSFLVDIDGEIITEINSDKYEDKLIFIRGEYSNLNLNKIIKDLNIIFSDLVNNIEELEYVEERRWNIKLKNNLIIKLPDEKIQKSLENLKKLFEDQKIMDSNIIEIDLRIHGRAAIKVLDGKVNYGLDEI